MAMKSYTNLCSNPGDFLKNFDVIGETEPKSFVNANGFKETNESSRPSFRDKINQSMQLFFIEYCHKFSFGQSLEPKRRKISPTRQYGKTRMALHIAAKDAISWQKEVL